MEDGNGGERLVTLRLGGQWVVAYVDVWRFLPLEKEKGNQFQELDLNGGKKKTV